MEISRACLCLFLVLFALFQTPTFAAKKLYVVYLGTHSHGQDPFNQELVAESHYDLLGSYIGGKEKAREAISYTYSKSMNGFAANLDENEAMELAKREDVVSVFPSKINKLHTTHSWQFLGLEGHDGKVHPNSLWSRAKYGEDVIIGNLDTGVWPESESFNDQGMGPVPARWKGICQNATEVKCNRKLIGTRYYYKGMLAAGGTINTSMLSPRDFEGHGTHTLSTAAGQKVPNASIMGQANGTASGGAPNARVAAYKICWPEGCTDADMLAAFDQAIADGVDVLSVSVGGPAGDYSTEAMAIGSFHAVKNGITVVCSAGNDGPTAYTASNVAPWILTVAASTFDRYFPSDVKLGNNQTYAGQSLSNAMPQKFYPMINSEFAKVANSPAVDAQLCKPGSLDPAKVKGKVVVCLRGDNGRMEKGEVVKEAGGTAMILANEEASGDEILSDPHALPATQISYKDGLSVYNYLSSTKAPMAYITTPSTEYGYKPSPAMAAFSSRGPNSVTPEILKPDITAPGVNVLAGYTLAQGPSENNNDTRRVPYIVMSGTSMSCPHVSGVVGLLKAIHPDWSPSAIRSAIMTTAYTKDNLHKPIINDATKKAGPFDYGAGHIRPNRAVDPGLVYDLTVTDYLNFLCKLGYNSTVVNAFSGTPYKCQSNLTNLISFNYPSITVPVLDKGKVLTRTVKNVGTPATYTARIIPPPGVSVIVEPKNLTFTKVGEEKTYKLVLAPNSASHSSQFGVGKITWSDGAHHVRSPIVVNSKGYMES